MNESRNHHFVPKLLLRPWLKQDANNQNVLNGYYWNNHRNKLEVNSKGLDAFCCQSDLLTLKSHKLGGDAIERIFFGEVDTKGAVVKDILLKDSNKNLTLDQRCDFARLLLSLDARRPAIVEKLRNAGTESYIADIDDDSKILAAMFGAGIKESPSSYYTRSTGVMFEDIGVATIQKLVDTPQIGGSLINSHWYIKHLDEGGSLVLADRPLIRINGHDQLGAVWVLPLTPKAAFVAVNHLENLERIKRVTSQRFIKATNYSSAFQAEKFVFSIDASHSRWLHKYLKPKL